MQPPLAAVDAADTLDRVFADLSGGQPRGGRRPRRPPGRDADPLRPARVPRARPERFVSAPARGASPACRGGTGIRDPVSGRPRRTTWPTPSGACRAVQLDSISTVDRCPPPDPARRASAATRRAPSRGSSGAGASSSTGRTRRACSRSRTGRSHAAGCSPGPTTRGGATIIDRDPALADRILGEIRERGPLGSRALRGRAHRGRDVEPEAGQADARGALVGRASSSIAGAAGLPAAVRPPRAGDPRRGARRRRCRARTRCCARSCCGRCARRGRADRGRRRRALAPARRASPESKPYVGRARGRRDAPPARTSTTAGRRS